MKKHSLIRKVIIKKIAFALMAIVILFALFLFSITSLDDPLSTMLRSSTENYVDQYSDRLMINAEQGELSLMDKVVIHTSIKVGVLLTRWAYPEASMLLNHYVYGDGSDLELSSTYFKESPYLQRIVSQYGDGEHGPIGLKQSDDWRLSLALNPYYLSITEEIIKLYHPTISFAPTHSERVVTIVPIGKLRINVYDNLVNAVNPKPFYVYSSWGIDS